MELLLNPDDLKSEIMQNKPVAEISFHDLNEKAQQAVKIVGQATFISYDGKREKKIWG